MSYKGKYVHEVLVNHPGKSVIRWTDRLNMTIAIDWDVKNPMKQTKQWSCSNKEIARLDWPESISLLEQLIVGLYRGDNF